MLFGASPPPPPCKYVHNTQLHGPPSWTGTNAQREVASLAWRDDCHAWQSIRHSNRHLNHLLWLWPGAQDIQGRLKFSHVPLTSQRVLACVTAFKLEWRCWVSVTQSHKMVLKLILSFLQFCCCCWDDLHCNGVHWVQFWFDSWIKFVS